MVLDIPHRTDYKLSVYDMFGKLIKEVNGETQGQLLKETIELNGLNDGTYFMRIAFDDQVSSKKIVKIN